MRALVVFETDAEMWWMRFLKPGFRHCSIAVERNGFWIIYDPLFHQSAMDVLDGYTFEGISARLRAAGKTVVSCNIRPAPLRAAPWRPFTCVEAVKRVLGIHDGLINTPYQLFKFLKERT